MKILVIGGTKGFGKNIVDYFKNGSVGVGRSNGFDITNGDLRKKMAGYSLNFDAVLIHAYTPDLSQMNMLRSIYTAWKENKKLGYIFTSGSYATFTNPLKVREYLAIKQSINTYHKQLSVSCIEENLPFNMCLFQFGCLDDKKGRSLPQWHGQGIRVIDFCNIIETLYKLPSDYMLPEIVLTSKENPDILK